MIRLRNSYYFVSLFNNSNFTTSKKPHQVIQFILNDMPIKTDMPVGTTLLDFIRYERRLHGTKIGCREGDCGACTVLVGEIDNDRIAYHSVTSCLMPLGNVQGKHIVTIEGLNFEGLNPVQEAMCDEGATQCGFCTPGFVVSLSGFLLQDKYADPVASIDGNICRCTGYKSIQRAAYKIVGLLETRGNTDPISFAVNHKFVPEYFASIKSRLLDLQATTNGEEGLVNPGIFVGSGTDLYVQRHEEMVHARSTFLTGHAELRGIRLEDNTCIVGSATTVTDLMMSTEFRKIFPAFADYSKLVSSTPIRNMATLGGNFVNASPIGDFTIYFLALDATLCLSNGKSSHRLPLREFYLDYKKLNKKSTEYIRDFSFEIKQGALFNFEKVSKRMHLDIASVNSAIRIIVDGPKIISAEISAGGVSPVPMFLREASSFLEGRMLSEELVSECCDAAGSEISPLSDARGTATYKRFLLQQLIKAHFLKLFPHLQAEKFETFYEEY